MSSTMSDKRAAFESSVAVSRMILQPILRRIGSTSASSVPPLRDRPMTTSSGCTMPRSPWKASTGCIAYDIVPVLASVAWIFSPMIRALPMPVTHTRPLHSSTRFTASMNSSPSSPSAAAMAWLSAFSTARPRARIARASRL